MSASTSTEHDEDLIRAVFNKITLLDVKFSTVKDEPEELTNYCKNTNGYHDQNSNLITIPSPSPRSIIKPANNDIKQSDDERDQNQTCQSNQYIPNDSHYPERKSSSSEYFTEEIEIITNDTASNTQTNHILDIDANVDTDTEIQVRHMSYSPNHKEIHEEELGSDSHVKPENFAQDGASNRRISLRNESVKPSIYLIPTSKLDTGEMLTNGSESSEDGCLNSPAEFSPRSLDSENWTEVTSSPGSDQIPSSKLGSSISVVEVNDFKPPLSYSSFEPEKHELIRREIGKLPKVRDIMYRFQQNILNEDEQTKNASNKLPKRTIQNGKENSSQLQNQHTILAAKKVMAPSPLKVQIQMPLLDVSSADGDKCGNEKRPIVKTPHPSAWTRRRSPPLQSGADDVSQEIDSPLEENQRPVSEILAHFAGQDKNLDDNRSSRSSIDCCVSPEYDSQKELSKNSVMNENRPKNLPLLTVDVWQNGTDNVIQNDVCDTVDNENSRNTDTEKVEENIPLYQTYWGVGGTLKSHRHSTDDFRPVGSSAAIVHHLRSVPVSPTVNSPTFVSQSAKSNDLQKRVLGLRKVQDFYNVWGRVDADASK